MAHNAIKSSGANTPSSGGSQDIEESESEGTSENSSAETSVKVEEDSEKRGGLEDLQKGTDETQGSEDSSEQKSCSVYEDISCGVKKKKMGGGEKRNLELKGTSRIKVVGSEALTDSVETGKLVEGSASLNLAKNMERVNSDSTYFGCSGSPYLSSEEDWEARVISSESDADHSDSSDDDNPKSQVDQMINDEAFQWLDGETSNLTSETEDSDSDITDVSPMISNSNSPLWGLSPAVSRRNLPSAFSNRQPFMRHYSQRGHEGDDEDEEEDITKWRDNLFLDNQNNTNLFTANVHKHNEYSNLNHEDNMSYVVQALLNLELERAGKKSNSIDTNMNKENRNELPHIMRRCNSHMSPALVANPHHRHLRKHSHPRRKNMSFTNEEVRKINRDNSIMLDKLLAVHNRSDKTQTSNRKSGKPANSTINRRKQEQGIQRDNIAFLRRLEEVKPSREITAASLRTSERYGRTICPHHSPLTRSTSYTLQRPSQRAHRHRHRYSESKDPSL